ncbi:transposase [Streptomyces sp. NPDC012746]|uniref:transposase n=1 Tax=Streptomyces sp. NPDC012746 TaxID=3364845 RepID=UPI003697A7B6
MNHVSCPHCGGLTPYRIRPDGLFGCDECGNLVDPRDISLDGNEVWGVDAECALVVFADPVTAFERLHEYLADFLDDPADSYGEAASLNAFEWAAADLIDAIHAGIQLPEMEN